MLTLITYDVSTGDLAGRRRLRQVAKCCIDYGQRVQSSVFECDADAATMAMVKAKLVSLIDPSVDSLRFYNLGDNFNRRVEHVGAKPTYDPEGFLTM